MRKGKGELTYHQLKVINEDLKRQIRNLETERDKIRADYNSLKIAHNKLLKQSQGSGPKGPSKTLTLKPDEMVPVRSDFLPPPPMGFIGFNGGAKR